MPCMPNWKYSEQVGLGKKYNDVIDLYNQSHGQYDCCDAKEAKIPANKVKGSVYESLPFALKK